MLRDAWEEGSRMATVPLSGAEREQVRDAYVVTALWTATDEDGNGFDDYAEKTVDYLPHVAEEIRTIVDGFIDLVEESTDPALADPWAGMDAAQIGHDLFLTSAHHGAGFWDRGLGERGDALTKLAQTFTPPFICFTDATGTDWMA